jgi:hypothetical protein
MDITNLTPEQLRAAADLKEQIDGLQNELNELLVGEVAGPTQAAIEAPEKPENGRRKKRKKISAEGRANIAAAQRARWAARRREAPSLEVPATEVEKPAKQPKKTKKQMREAKLAALAKARAARWAKHKAARQTKV